MLPTAVSAHSHHQRNPHKPPQTEPTIRKETPHLHMKLWSFPLLLGSLIEGESTRTLLPMMILSTQVLSDTTKKEFNIYGMKYQGEDECQAFCKHEHAL